MLYILKANGNSFTWNSVDKLDSMENESKDGTNEMIDMHTDVNRISCCLAIRLRTSSKSKRLQSITFAISSYAIVCIMHDNGDDGGSGGSP